MVYLAEKTKTLKEARKLLETNLNNGKALAKFKSFIKNQSGDETVINDQTRLLQAKYTFDLKRSEEHTSELQSRFDLVCRLLLETSLHLLDLNYFPTRRSSDLMVYLAEKTKTLKEARKLLETNLNNGKALAKFKSFIKNQSGDETVINDQTRLLQAKYTFDLKAHNSGYLKKIMANELGKIAMTLGAGREQKESIINLGVRIILHKKVGDFI